MSSETGGSPPVYVIEAARQAAIKSPCAKSKRGVALFNRENADHLDKCAVSSFGEALDLQRCTGERYPVTAERHREILDSVVVACGFNGQPDGFSCTGSEGCRRDCAKLCLHAEQRAIWRAGNLDDLVDLELVHVKVEDDQVVPGGGPSCWQCSRLIVEVKLRGVWLYEGFAIRTAEHRKYVEPFRWRYYAATEFHRETIHSCDLYQPP